MRSRTRFSSRPVRQPGPRRPNARGGQSRHNFGIAWDIGIFGGGTYVTTAPPYDRAAEVGLCDGHEWGGCWTSFVGRPHYQLALPFATAGIRSRMP
jgi:peptidoglycan LD-endopeptidase CwlK